MDKSKSPMYHESSDLLDAIRDQYIMSITDALGNIIEVNDTFCKISQYSRDELIGNNHRIINSGFHESGFFSRMWKIILSGKSWRGEVCNRAKDGTLYWVDSVITPLRDSNGTIDRFVSIRSDITQKKRQELESSDLLNTIRKQYIMSITDAKGTIIDVNDTFCAISKFDRKELIGQNHRIVNSGQHEPDFFKDMWKTISSGRSWRGEICNRAKDGSIYWVDSVITPLHNADGNIDRFVSIRSDISNRKRQENELLKSKFLLDRTGQIAGVGGWELDLNTMTIYWSKETCLLHGVEPGYQPTLDEAINFYAPEARQVVRDAVEHAVATGESWDIEVPFIRANGEHLFVRAVGSAEYANGKAQSLIGAFQDVTKIRTMRDQLEEQHELLEVTLDSIGDAVITTDAHGVTQWLNPVAQRLTGWTKEDARGRPLEQVFHIINEDTRLKTENPVETCLTQGKIVGLANHTVLISKSGEEFGIEDSAAPIRSKNGAVLGVVLVFHDVTEQRRLSSEVSYRATHDALTDLVNRSEFETRLTHLLNSCHSDYSTHALMYIDLDQFKIINDTCGHSVGDKALIQVSKLFDEVIRSRDTLARLGGDEFGVILEHCNETKAQRVAQKICDKMEDFRFVHDNHRFRIGASIGLVAVDNRWSTPALIMQAADNSCFAAKDAGRNRVHVFSDSDLAIRTRHGEMQWTTRIENALDENRFVLFAQKITSIQDNKTSLHAEVLVRMIDESGDIVPPGAFFPAAERFHLASRIDRWVIQNSVNWLVSLSNNEFNHIGTLCINLSGQSIGDRAFHNYVCDLFQQLEPNCRNKLCIEITETVAITNLTDASLFIERLKNLGVSIALDDFGAGASSFGYLKNLNVDVLKIDGQFIQDILTDPLDEVAVRCFIDVANVVGLKTVAEYVDHEDVLAKVKELGIDYAQGFLLHKPEKISHIHQQK